MTDKFLLLDSVIGFRIEELEGLILDKEEDGIRLSSVPKYIKDETGSFGGLSLPTGIAVDNYGNIYIVDKTNSLILKYDLCKELPVPLKCVGGKGNTVKEFDFPTGIAISRAGNVYITDSNNHRVQVFTVAGFVLRDVWGKTDTNGKPISGSEKGAFKTPWDLAVNSKKFIYIVDRGNNRIQKFSPDGGCVKTFGSTKLSDPLHIAIDKKDFVYVIDSNPKVKKFNSDGIFVEEIEYIDDIEENFFSPQPTVDAAGRVHYEFKYSKVNLVLNHNFELEEDLKDDECVIIKEGLVPGIYFDKDKLVIDHENTPKPREEEVDYLAEGFLYTKAFDSKEYKCQWHKILLDADIPLGTSITVQTYTAETKKDFLEIKNLDKSIWRTNQKNAKNFLIQGSPGRYLWLKLTLRGNKKETPLVKKLKIYYPRLTYLEYLPGIYQTDPTSKLFLEQFLSIFAHFFEGIEDEVDNIVRYFIPGATPVKFLPWLASWLSLSLNDKWPVEKKRLFIHKAHELFKKRGTLEGLQEVLEIFTEKKFQIIEHFKLRRKYLILSNNSIIGCNSFLWGMESSLSVNTELSVFKLGDSQEPVSNPFQAHAHEFSILIPSKFLSADEDERIIRKIVDLWKPAHTKFYLCKIEPRFRIGMQSSIGTDTIIGKYSD
ncbi:MAG: phage tail protein, partial [candidate division WOR-3 bacterium]